MCLVVNGLAYIRLGLFREKVIIIRNFYKPQQFEPANSVQVCVESWL